MDHNATTPMPEAVRRAVADGAALLRGNPSSPHAEGRAARAILDEAREEIARLAGVEAAEVIFTSGGTESNNLALRGMTAQAQARGRRVRIVTSAVEHPSVLETCRALEAGGAQVELLRVDQDGLVDPEDLESSLRREGADIVSIMHANNETGVIQPLEELAAVAARHGAAFHSDMAQSAGKISVTGAAPGASAVTLASHKIGGPPGIGALVLGRGTKLVSQLSGGGQEEGRRAGTESAFLAAGFSAALRLLDLERSRALARLRDRIESELPLLSEGARVHGGSAPRVPNTTSFFLPDLPGRHLVVQLDLLGFAISTGSACSTGSARPSHVLEAMGCPPAEAVDSVRISLAPSTREEEVDALLEALREVAARGRAARAGSDARHSAPARTP